MKKMIKDCTISLYVRKTNVLAEDSSYNQPYNAFHGDKNEVMRYLRKFLIKNLEFSKNVLTDTLNLINDSSKVYKSVGEGTYETVVHTFNPETETLYTFKIKYVVKKLPNTPHEYKVNDKGENLREKRLIQLYGGGLFGRYQLALESVNTGKLLELLSPTIQARFKEESAIKFLGNDKFRIEYPRYFEFKPNDDLCIKISLSSYDFNTVTVYIVYKGNNVYLLDKYSNKVTKEKLDEVLKLAEQFDEICEIVKKSYQEY
jgi:hypothetical protein